MPEKKKNISRLMRSKKTCVILGKSRIEETSTSERSLINTYTFLSRLCMNSLTLLILNFMHEQTPSFSLSATAYAISCAQEMTFWLLQRQAKGVTAFVRRLHPDLSLLPLPQVQFRILQLGGRCMLRFPKKK